MSSDSPRSFKKDLFQQLLWPATAGNVVWSFFSIVVESDFGSHITYAKLALLLVLSIYLVDEWYRVSVWRDELPLKYWIGDGLLLIPIVLVAIGVTKPEGPLHEKWLEISLISAFAITAVGHLFGVWSKNWIRNGWLAAVNGAGTLALWWSWVFLPRAYPWNLPVCLLGVLIAWFVINRAYPGTTNRRT